MLWLHGISWATRALAPNGRAAKHAPFPTLARHETRRRRIAEYITTYRREADMTIEPLSGSPIQRCITCSELVACEIVHQPTSRAVFRHRGQTLEIELADLGTATSGEIVDRLLEFAARAHGEAPA